MFLWLAGKIYICIYIHIPNLASSGLLSWNTYMMWWFLFVLSVWCTLCLALGLLFVRMQLCDMYWNLCLKPICVGLCRNLQRWKRKRRKRCKSNQTHCIRSFSISAATLSQRGGQLYQHYPSAPRHSNLPCTHDSGWNGCQTWPVLLLTISQLHQATAFCL